MHCTFRPPKVLDNDREDDKRSKMAQNQSVQHLLLEATAGMTGFWKNVPLQTVVKQTGIPHNLYDPFFLQFRMMIDEAMNQKFSNGPHLGGPAGKIAIDETYVTSKKHLNGGFHAS